MESVPRGTCLIISNECFDPEDLSDRKGTDLDAKNLEETFRWLQFEVNTHSNLSAIDMWEVISQYSKKSYDRYDCFVCCILSHGSSGGFYTEIQGKPMFLERSGAGSIYGTDGKLIPTECLRKLFLGSHCASLHGKPKLFFIQACRGPRIDTGNPTGTWLHVAADGPSDCQDILTEEAGKFLASDSDFACVYATVPEHKAYKDRGTGKSWFITTLCKVFQQNADSSDLMSMITEVNRLMADQVGYWNEQWVVQIGENRNNLRKHLYFRPLQTWTQYKSEQLQ